MLMLPLARRGTRENKRLLDYIPYFGKNALKIYADAHLIALSFRENNLTSSQVRFVGFIADFDAGNIKTSQYKDLAGKIIHYLVCGEAATLSTAKRRDNHDFNNNGTVDVAALSRRKAQVTLKDFFGGMEVSCGNLFKMP